MRFALVQFNSLVGAPLENVKMMLETVDKNKDHASVFIFPELSVLGYPCRDLLSQKNLFTEEQAALEKLKHYTSSNSVTLIVGHSSPAPQQLRPLYNSASVIQQGTLTATIHKHRIPSYDIFEEDRFFASGPKQNQVVEIEGKKIGLFICEDGWTTTQGFGRQDIRMYRDEFEPIKYLESADIVINLSASPFAVGKRVAREDLFSAFAQRLKRPLIYVNCVGGQDDILFDGASFVINATGEKVLLGPAFEESVLFFDDEKLPPPAPIPDIEINGWEQIHSALVMGIRDYVLKTGRKKVLLGLSGGIDSSLVAVLATEALGKENVLGVTLSSKLTGQDSVRDAHELGKNLGIEVLDLQISDLVESAQKQLGLSSSGLSFENLQSRTRALLLMALSNERSAFLLATSNKSELAMGYGTLYGDMCGALMPLGDLLKTEVFGLSHYLNSQDVKQQKTPRIPLHSLLREPTAELAPGQKDEDSLPPYEKLDTFLDDYLHNSGQLRSKIEHWDKFLGPRHSVASLTQKIHSQEFKRRQAPPILRVHNRAFGQGWRMPLAKGFFQ